MNRRTWLLHASCLLLADRLAVGAFGSAGPTDRLRRAASSGRKFLAGLFDSTLNLLPEYRGASVYWLFHDNYLAAKVLRQSHPEIARKIGRAIEPYGVTKSVKIEILFGESKEPLPFRQYRLIDVKRIGGKTIKTEIVTGNEMKGWEEYADLLLLAAFALAEKHPPQAKKHFHQAMEMWDGKGLNDRATAKSGIYATYKLALALIAAGKLKAKPTFQQAMLDRLLAQQKDDGGWITDYKASGKRIGLANVETTSLAIMAIDSVLSDESPPAKR